MTTETEVDPGRDTTSKIVDEGDSGSPTRRWLELCHCRRELFAFKAFYFAFLGALGIFYSYYVVCLKQHGLSAFEIGIIAGVRPLIGSLSAPTCGALTDRYGIRRSLMIVSLLAWLVFISSFYAVSEPVGRAECPESWQPFLQRGKLRLIMDRDLADDNSTASFQLPTTGGSSRRSGSSTMTASKMSAYPDRVKPQTTYSHAFVFPSSSTDKWIFVDESSSRESNSSLLGDVEQELLREDLDWMYEPTSRFHVFIICFLLIVGAEFFQAPPTAMADAATLQILGRERLDQFGAQRAWGPSGWAIGSFVTGYILDAVHWDEVKCGVTLSFTEYYVASAVIVPLIFVSIVAAFYINVGTEISAKSVNEKTNLASYDASNVRSVPPPSHQHSTLAVVKVFLNLRHGSWLLTTFYLAFLYGLLSSFLYWHLENIGGSKLLMGIDSVIFSVFEFFSFFVADYVIQLIGHKGVMYVSLLVYAVRLIVYASITNPWAALSTSAAQGCTMALIWVSLSQYSALLVPSTSLGTIQGIMHGVYFGLGYGVGSFVGGVLIGQFGAVVAFYGVAVATIVWLMVFVVCQKFSKEPTNPFAYQDMDVDNGAKSLTGSDHSY